MTAGTNQLAIRSARRAIGGRAPWACSTSRTIWASAVSAPTRVARRVNVPLVFSVAPMTSSPGPFTTGSASPVSIASSTAEDPSTTTPSTGTFSPGRTRTMSSWRTSAMGRSTSPPPRTTRAVRGCRPMSVRMASPVWPLARASSRRPSRMRVMMSAAESKYIGVPRPWWSKKPGKSDPGGAVEVGGRRAQHDQRVHGGAAVARGRQRGAIELPADPELHRCGQRPQDPAVGEEGGHEGKPHAAQEHESRQDRAHHDLAPQAQVGGAAGESLGVDAPPARPRRAARRAARPRRAGSATS